jgi:hypothetical protein
MARSLGLNDKRFQLHRVGRLPHAERLHAMLTNDNSRLKRLAVGSKWVITQVLMLILVKEIDVYVKIALWWYHSVTTNPITMLVIRWSLPSHAFTEDDP